MADLILEKLDKLRAKGYRPVVVGCFVRQYKVLMVYKAKHKLWQLPQGGIEPLENISQALIREMKEELNVDLVKADLIYLGNDFADFPRHNRGGRELITRVGQKILMKGKKYFFIAVKTRVKNLDISKSEFDDYRWVDFKQGSFLADKIYQPGKKRITRVAFDLLKHKKMIK